MSAVLFVIDASPAIQRLVQEAARLADCDLVAFKDGLTALEAAPTLKPELILADYHMDGIGFPSFCQRLRSGGEAAETPIIAFITFSDQLDEGLLRSFGVKALLTKPLHPDHLLQTIRRVRSGPPPLSKREEAAEQRISLASSAQRLFGTPAQRPTVESLSKAGADPVAPRIAADAAPSQPPDRPVAAEPSLEQIVHDLAAHLARTAREQAQQEAARLLPDLVVKETRAHLLRTVQAELPALIEAAVPREQLTHLVQEALRQLLPDLVKQQISIFEPTIRQQLQEIARPLAERVTETLTRELVDPAVQQHLGGALRQQLGPIETLVKEAVEVAVSHYTGPAAEAAVREVAGEVTRQAAERIVREIVPDLAEAAIKEEIERLTA